MKHVCRAKDWLLIGCAAFFASTSLAEVVRSVNANGYAHGNAIAWRPADDLNLTGYNLYRSTAEAGPFAFIGSADPNATEYLDPQPANNTTRYYYYVTATTASSESDPSTIVWARYNGFTDEQLLDQIQWATFRYFWTGAHPISGLTRESIDGIHSADIVTMGGSGFGMMAIIVGVERGWITRAAAADHLLGSVTFLEETADRFHGVWPHWMSGTTGQTVPFSPQDDGADLVESSFLMQGMLTVRQYFDDPNDPTEVELRTRINRLWEEMEFNWFRRYSGSDVLYWHWSPNFEWAMNLPMRGYYETTISYLLAVASPTYPIPASSYINGWTGLPSYKNGNSYYGIKLNVGQPYGGPLFFTHYSNLGFDPRYRRDTYANYYFNSRNIARIHHAHCIENPGGYKGYGPFCWGLTASLNPWGYLAHSPTNDNGTITPTAAVASMPYTPQESLAALRHFYDVYGDELLGQYGFKDAFNPTQDWTATGYLAIDQGPIVVMIENYRTGLIWDLFMSSPEIEPMMAAIGFHWEIDIDSDGLISPPEIEVMLTCMNGPNVDANPICAGSFLAGSDLDDDEDVDIADYWFTQRLINAP